MSGRITNRRRVKEERIESESHTELVLATLNICDPVTGRTIKVMPDWDSGAGKPSQYKFSFLGQDGYYHYFDVRELSNWREFDHPHPPYRDHEVLKGEWETQKRINNDLMTFFGLKLQLPFRSWLIAHRDPEWEEYFKAKDSYIENKIVEAANQGLLDLSL